jgi:outer membrane protein TolC
MDAAGDSAQQAREEVIWAVTGTYLQFMATIARVEEQRVEVEYAQASYEQARAQTDAGNKAPIGIGTAAQLPGKTTASGRSFSLPLYNCPQLDRYLL